MGKQAYLQIYVIYNGGFGSDTEYETAVVLTDRIIQDGYSSQGYFVTEQFNHISRSEQI